MVISYTLVAPEIAVFDGVGTGGTERTDNTGTHAFGSVLMGASSTAQSFTIQNTGTSVLTLGVISLGGTDSGQFSVNLGSVDTTLAANETTTFTVTFSPTSTGAKTAVVSIASDDADESPFEINLSGTGVAPEIVVSDGADAGGADWTGGTGTHAFGSVLVGASSTAQSFTIENTGTSVLTLGSISLGGTNSDQFSLNLTGVDMSLAANESTSFTVTFSPTSTGAKTAVVSITSDDADENPFEISLSGTGVAPEIAVFDGVGTGGTERTDNTGTQAFGSVGVGASSTAQSFTIQNTGTSVLNLGVISLGGTNSNQFSLNLTGVDTTLAANETTTFTVTFSPTSVGAKAAVVSIASDDANENPFEIQLSGSGIEQEIAVYEGLGTSGTARMDNVGITSFASVTVGASSAAQTFTIENAGSGSLTLGVITLGGSHPDQFSLNIAGLDTSLAAGETTSFTVTFSPTSAGNKSAVVNIASDDTDENPFRLNFSGTGIEGDDVAMTDQSLTEAEGLVGGGSLYRPMPGVINQLGQVSFKAFGKVGTGGILAGNDALFLTDVSGGIHVIGREGTQVAAGSAASLNGLMTCNILTEGGRTLFFDRLLNSAVLQDQAYFLSENGMDLEVLCRTGDAAAGGGAMKTVNTSIVADASDRFYYSGSLVGSDVTTRTDTAIWQEENGTIRLLGREGDNVTTLTTDPAWLGTVSVDLSASADGVAFIAALQHHPTDSTQRTDTARNEVVLDGNEDGLAVIARKGDGVPDTGGGSLSVLSGVSRSATGAHAILARLKASTNVTTSNDQVLLSVSGGTVRLIAREGVTLIEGVAMRSVRDFYAIGDDEVLFLSDRALCRWTASGGISVLACIGNMAPGLGSEFRLISRLSVSEGGAITLFTSLNNGRSILWRALPGAGLIYVLGTGDTTTVNGATETIYAFGIYADGAATSGGGGRGAAINNSGTILATLSLGDGLHVARKLEP